MGSPVFEGYWGKNGKFYQINDKGSPYYGIIYSGFILNAQIQAIQRAGLGG
jgi:hypothetical protein